MNRLKLFLLISSTIFIVANPVDNNQTKNLNQNKNISSSTRGISTIAVASYIKNNEQCIDWHIKIGNPSHIETLKINGEFKIIDTFGKILNETNSTFTIPPRKARTYRNRSLKVKVLEDTKAYIQANLGGVISRSNYFIIHK